MRKKRDEGRRTKAEGRGSRVFISLPIYCSLLTLILCSLLFAQTGNVRVLARAWPTRVTLGDEIRFFILTERPLAYKVELPSPKTNLGPFEIKKAEVLPVRLRQGAVSDTFLLTLTVFELGDVRIPPIALTYKEEAGRSGKVWTEPVLIHVVGVPKRPTDKGALRPIKPPVSFDLSILRTILLGLGAFLLSAFLVIKIIRRRRRQRLLDLESLKPPHERVFLELERLNQKGFLPAGKVKEHYSEFADILRRYLERRFGVETLELTTFELMQRLKEKEFNNALSAKIRNILENSDLVKFAKYLPPRALADELEILLRQIVEETKQESESDHVPQTNKGTR